jgi:hypothetical protein
LWSGGVRCHPCCLRRYLSFQTISPRLKNASRKRRPCWQSMASRLCRCRCCLSQIRAWCVVAFKSAAGMCLWARDLNPGDGAPAAGQQEPGLPPSHAGHLYQCIPLGFGAGHGRGGERLAAVGWVRLVACTSAGRPQRCWGPCSCDFRAHVWQLLSSPRCSGHLFTHSAGGILLLGAELTSSSSLHVLEADRSRAYSTSRNDRKAAMCYNVQAKGIQGSFAGIYHRSTFDEVGALVGTRKLLFLPCRFNGGASPRRLSHGCGTPRTLRAATCRHFMLCIRIWPTKVGWVRG